MDFNLLEQESEYRWRIAPRGNMRVPGILYADHDLIADMDHKVYEQLCNVATLPGIVNAAYAMPDAHWGYGFPIGGVAAFDVDSGGVVSAGGVGFDISCGVRALHTGIGIGQLQAIKTDLANRLFEAIPAGVGSTGALRLDMKTMDKMLEGGAAWAVNRGYGLQEDLTYIEEHGCMKGADPSAVSQRSKQRQHAEMGTLGSGNHYLEVQKIAEIYDTELARVFSLNIDEIIISIHCGSRGLGHQIGTEYLRDMALAAREFGIELPDRELACAPIKSELGQRYLGAMRAGINCALANRQILTHLTRKVITEFFPECNLPIIYDVSHNTCKEETHEINGQVKSVFVHRKGATRAFGPEHANIPDKYRQSGQPVIIGGSMGTSSYLLAGTREGEKLSYSSACHGAGRAMSRNQAKHKWRGSTLVRELESRGILIRSPSMRGVAEEAPGAYKDVSRVVEVADRAGLAKMVARVEPLICIKG